MSTNFPFGVFLSRSSKDKPRVRRLAERLKAAGVQMEAGLRLWLDDWVITVASVYDRRGKDRRSQSAATAAKMDEGLEQSRVLLLCLSPAALWYRLEHALLVVFRELYGEPPRCNDQTDGKNAGTVFDLFAHAKVKRVLENLA